MISSRLCCFVSVCSVCMNLCVVGIMLFLFWIGLSIMVMVLLVISFLIDVMLFSLVFGKFGICGV